MSLKKAAAACGSHKGAGGIESGEDAPRPWQAGRYNDALAYVSQDVRATADVARYLLERGGFTWISNSGRPSRFSLPRQVRQEGLTAMTVERVRRWPLPDTSGMADPIYREDFLRWLTES